MQPSLLLSLEMCVHAESFSSFSKGLIKLAMAYGISLHAILKGYKVICRCMPKTTRSLELFGCMVTLL